MDETAKDFLIESENPDRLDQELGVFGSFVAQEGVPDLIDIPGMVREDDPGFAELQRAV